MLINKEYNTSNENKNVSYFLNKCDVVKDVHFEKIITSIKNGHFDKLIHPLRENRAKGNLVWKYQKFRLPGFTPSGTFDKVRQKEHLLKYNGIIGIDFDDVELNVESVNPVIEIVNADIHTLASFISPSGNGFKVYTQVDIGFGSHDVAYTQVANYYHELTQLRVDPSGKDYTRYAYVSSDHNAYYNEQSEVFHISEEAQKVTELKNQEKRFSQKGQLFGTTQFQKVVDLTLRKQQWIPKNHHNFVLLLGGNCNRWAIPIDDALNHILNSEYNFKQDEVIKIVQSVYQRNTNEFGKYPLNSIGKANKQSQSANLNSQIAEKTGTVKREFAEIADFAQYKLDGAVNDTIESPIIPQSVYVKLPDILKIGASAFSDLREKDVFLTGAIGVLSGCLPTISGNYGNEVLFPNLFTFITAPAASGKGALNHARNYGIKLHEKLLNESNITKSKKLLFIPGNASAAALISHLQENDGRGIFMETEADTLTNTFKNEWGNFDDLLRKGFHHEPVSYTRKANNEYISIKAPKLSVVLSGTPNQVIKLINSTENGLFSRFLYYNFQSTAKWRDVSPNRAPVNFLNHFKLIQEEAFEVIEKLMTFENIDFQLTPMQWSCLNETQEKNLDQSVQKYGNNIASPIVRNGLMWFRIAMILSALRQRNKIEENLQLICSDLDFYLAKELMEVYKIHTLNVYSTLPQQQEVVSNDLLNEFFSKLPKEQFHRKDAVELGQELKMGSRSIDAFLKKLLIDNKLHQPKYGTYEKI